MEEEERRIEAINPTIPVMPAEVYAAVLQRAGRPSSCEEAYRFAEQGTVMRAAVGEQLRYCQCLPRLYALLVFIYMAFNAQVTFSLPSGEPLLKIRPLHDEEGDLSGWQAKTYGLGARTAVKEGLIRQEDETLAVDQPLLPKLLRLIALAGILGAGASFARVPSVDDLRNEKAQWQSSLLAELTGNFVSLQTLQEWLEADGLKAAWGDVRDTRAAKYVRKSLPGSLADFLLNNPNEAAEGAFLEGQLFLKPRMLKLQKEWDACRQNIRRFRERR